MDTETINAQQNIRWLDPASIQAVWHPEAARLTVTIGDEPPIEDAQAISAFPIKNPDAFIQLSDVPGEQGGILPTLDGIPSDALAAIRKALDARYLIPRVSRVLHLNERAPGVLHWKVETNRGERVFFTESAGEAIRHLNTDRLRITDIEGNAYDLPSVASLDPASRERLSLFL